MINLNKILKSQSKNKRLVVIFPHPDDETVVTGGLLILAKKYGWKITVITLTKGEAGQCYVNKNGKTLSELREFELRNAIEVLGASKLIIGTFNDSKILENKYNIKKWIRMIIVKENPSVVITYDHAGFTGHPDHICLSIVTLEVIKSLNKSISLYWPTLPKNIGKLLINKKTIKYSSQPSHELKLGHFWFRKWLAVRKHKSQNLEQGKPFLFLYLLAFRKEWYCKVDLTKKYDHRFVYFRI